MKGKVISIQETLKHPIYPIYNNDLTFEQVREKCCKCGRIVTFAVTSKKGMSLIEWRRFWERNPNCGVKDDAISPENVYFHGICYDDWV